MAHRFVKHGRLMHVVCLAVLAITLIATPGCRDDVNVVRIAGEKFTMELALTEDQISEGMAWRESFPDQGGMLFVFPDMQVRRFWMKNCLIDMDVIFLDGRGIVTAMHEMKAEPLQRDDETLTQYESRLKLYSSRTPAQFAIELEAGSIDRLGVQPEDRIEMDLEGLKALVQ